MSYHSAHLLNESLRIVLYVNSEDTLRGQWASLRSWTAPMISNKL